MKAITSTLLTAFGLAYAPGAHAIRFEVKDVGFRNSVHFVSDAPLETIVGITNFISGWIDLDPNNLKEGIRGTLEVDVRTFETGMPARNTKVRDLFLGASKQPIAVFTPTRASGFSSNVLKPGSTVTGRVDGTLAANGVEMRASLPIRITSWKEGPMTKRRLAGNLIQVRSDFTLRLADYKIQVPQPFQGIINPEARFTVHFFGTDRVPSSTPP